MTSRYVNFATGDLARLHLSVSPIDRLLGEAEAVAAQAIGLAPATTIPDHRRRFTQEDAARHLALYLPVSEQEHTTCLFPERVPARRTTWAYNFTCIEL
jgi:hypothetical protein